MLYQVHEREAELRGMQIGEAIGEKRGMQLGEQRGKKLGEQLGREQERRENVQKMLKAKLSLDLVASITGLTLSEVQDIAEKVTQ